LRLVSNRTARHRATSGIASTCTRPSTDLSTTDRLPIRAGRASSWPNWPPAS